MKTKQNSRGKKCSLKFRHNHNFDFYCTITRLKMEWEKALASSMENKKKKIIKK